VKKKLYFNLCVFQPPPTNPFPPSSNFIGPGYNPVTNQAVNQTSNPFVIHSELQSSGDILQPMNKPQAEQQQAEQMPRQTSTGDLHSSLSKVAKSLGKCVGKSDNP
jgi:hypothetical protein